MLFKTKTMVTTVGLPLLIVKGKFQNLATMSVESLETFIPFLAKCSIKRAGATVINGIPEWWPSTIQYKFPLQKPKELSNLGYRKHLSSIVCRCYWYHNAQFLLPFCAEIAKKPESFYLQNNDDNTTSIFVVNNTSTIQVMKFNNENRDYDSVIRQKAKIFKRRLITKSQNNTPVMDIYLCENCDAEFSSHADVQQHEKECSVIKNGSSNDLLNEIEVLEHIKPGQGPGLKNAGFFDYLQLRPRNSSNSTKPLNSGQSNLFNNKTLGESYLIKNKSVEFSSIFGRKILEFSQRRSSKTANSMAMDFVESHCGQNSRNIREVREPIDYRVTRKKWKKNTWVHQYCFSKKQRRKKYKRLKTGLNEKSQKLLRKCKTVKVVLSKLPSGYWTSGEHSVNANCSDKQENFEMFN